MVEKGLVFTDRHGDTLSVTARNSPPEWNGSWDPIITISHGINNSISVVFVEHEVPDIIRKMVDGLNLDGSTLYCIIGKIQDLIDQKEQLRIG